jgi:hypothetical protein
LCTRTRSFGVEDQDAVLDRVEHDLPLAQALLLDLAGGVAEHGEGLDHAGDLVASTRGRQRGTQVAPGDRAHAPAERRQPRHEATVDVQPRERHQQGDGEAADGDAGHGRPVVDRPLAIDGGLELLAQLDREHVERLGQACQGPVGEDGPLDQPVEVGLGLSRRAPRPARAPAQPGRRRRPEPRPRAGPPHAPHPTRR